MSTTTTETLPSEIKAIPEFTVISRVASIPVVSSSLGTLSAALSNNTYTRSSYNQAKRISTSAYKLTEPLQTKLAPFIIRADSYANKAVDAVESRYPYPFKAQPEDFTSFVRERKQSTTDYVHERVNNVNKAIDDKVKRPVYSVASDIDKRFTPMVDYIEVTASRFKSSEAGSPAPPDAQYQYQRALALSKTLGENIFEYSNEQLKQFQTQSVIAQKASQTATSITTVATSSLTSAQTRIHTLSDNMLAELKKLQASTASLAASLQSTLHSQASHVQSRVPHQIQQSYTDLSVALASTVHELSDIITTKGLPVHEKVARVGKQVQDRVHPLLETVKKGVSDVLVRAKAQTETVVVEVTPEKVPSPDVPETQE